MADQAAPATLIEANPRSQPRTDVSHGLPTYPHGCLAFIKNIHTETNKTTLKKLLSAAFRQDGEVATGGEFDYLDYLKGIDSVRPLFIWHSCSSEQRLNPAMCVTSAMFVCHSRR